MIWAEAVAAGAAVAGSANKVRQKASFIDNKASLGAFLCVPKRSSNEPLKEVVRVTFRFHGAELGQIREVRDMLSLNNEVDAARYLMQRGLEAMTATLTSRRSQNLMAQQVNGEAMMKQLVAAMADAEKQAKEK
jgi:hypothetical protein